MAILNFDYKLKAVVRPIITQSFHYEIYADVTNGSGTKEQVNMYNSSDLVTNWNDSLSTAKRLSIQTVSSLAAPKLAELLTTDPATRVNSYFIWCADTRIAIVCLPDGSDSPYAWCSSLPQEDVDVETDWIIGPQVDTEKSNSKDAQTLVSDTGMTALLERNALHPMPKDYSLIQVEAISNNSKIVLTYSDKLYAYGFDIHEEEIVRLTPETNYIQLVRGLQKKIQVDLQVNGAAGIKKENLRWKFDDRQKIAQVVSFNGSHVLVQGDQAGRTNLVLMYGDNYSQPIQIEVVDPKGRLNITRIKERSFVGDENELHISAEYENSERFPIKLTTLTLKQGSAVIKKVSETSYRITPEANEILSLDLRVQSERGEDVSANIKMPVWNKQLYKFHTLPEEASMVAGEELTLSAYYDIMHEDMGHDDAAITWDIVEGNKIASISGESGKSVTIKALSPGRIKVRALAYGSESITTMTVQGQNQPMLKLTPSQAHIAPGQQLTIYAQILNSSATLVNWEVKDNGMVRVVKQNDTSLVIEGITNGEATIFAKTGDLSQQAIIEVSEAAIKMMAGPDPLPSTEAAKQNYFPSEDSPEQWENPKYEPNYIDGKGFSTTLYGRSHGTADRAHAIHSGIGDHDDLLVKKPGKENSVQSFQYAARLRGKRKHQIMIYPELNFQYGIGYKGDLFVTYNESPYKIGIDAYPPKKFGFTIQEDRMLPIEKEYEVNMEVAGSVAKKKLEWAAGYEAYYEQVDQGDVKDLFTSSKGIYVGHGDPSAWKLSGDGTFIYENMNRMFFSGTVATGLNDDYFNWNSYEVEFDFRTIGEGNPDPLIGDRDDDVVGIIFKARKDPDGKVRNFYMMLWESDQRVKGSCRIGDNLDGIDVYDADESVWGNHLVDSRNYSASDSVYQSYCTGTGWKDKHRRIYKVVDGKMYQVPLTEVPNNLGSGGNGWDYLTMESMKVRCTGKHAEVFMRHSLTDPYYKVFEFDTDWEEGSFGACNFSQAIEFHGIRVKRWIKFTGREPETGWATFEDLTPTPKVINPSSLDYIKYNLIAKLPSPNAVYRVGQITTEVKDPTAGSASAGLNADGTDKPVTVRTFNGPNAGTIQRFTYTKKGTATVTPDNLDNATGLVVFENVEDVFRSERSSFLSGHPDVNASTLNVTYTMVKPPAGDTEFTFESNKKLIFWHAAPEHVITEKTYEYIAYAHDGWLSARDLKEFVGGKWATYTITFKDSGDYAIDPKVDAWKWAKAGKVTTHRDPTDVLMLHTTKWYKGIFPADIKNEGVVNSDAKSYVEIPPNHEHYVDPYDGSPMPAIYPNLHYVLHKYPIGKLSSLWMYWESKPGFTTRNTTSPINAVTNEPLLVAERQNDRVVIVCDPDPRYVPWISGKSIGQGKVNGKRPFFSVGAGKANMVNVPTHTVFLPPNLTHIEGPFIETDDSRVRAEYDTFTKTASFSSDYQDAYIWYTDWYTDWVQDPRSFYAQHETLTTITDTITINPMLDSSYDENVFIEKIEAISSNPFVSVSIDKQDGDISGLLGTYYRYPLQTKIQKEGFVVGGDYHVKQQQFTVQEAVAAYQENGQPARELFLASQPPVRGKAHAMEQVTAHSIYVPASQSVLKILTAFMQNTGDLFPDMIVKAPNGEQFGVQANNGTWTPAPVSRTTFDNGNLITSATKYEYSGSAAPYELMTFTQPMEGTWSIEIYNQGITVTDYVVTSNIGNAVQQTFDLDFAPDPWNVTIQVGGVDLTNFVVDGKRITIGASLNKDDLVDVTYTAGGFKVEALPMQDTFTFYDPQPFTVLSVQKNGVDIPQSSTEGYTIEGQQFKLHGSYVTPGEFKIKYSTGSLNNVFALDQDAGLQVTVSLNGLKLDASKYSLAGRTLVVDRSLLEPKDWIHIQSYVVTSTFDPTKTNYLGEVQFSRVDANINFNWGSQSPFISTDPVPAAMDVRIESVIPDQIPFDLTLDMDISYPSSQAIDVSNFTGTWTKFDEHVGTDVGDWHGPPEAGYTKVTNLAAQTGRSGFFNPNHKDMTDYTFGFKVQETGSGSDNMYGAIFRFDSLNFYSFEMDAHWSHGAGGTDVQGMGVYRNICLNPSQYGIANLQYTKVQLGHLNEGWSFGADQTNEIKIEVINRTILVWVNSVLKFNLVDSSPDAILTGAWGPITLSQPKVNFWDFHVATMQKYTFAQNPAQRHQITATVTRPVRDTPRSMEVKVSDKTMLQEFQSEISSFLSSHAGLTQDDLYFSFDIRADNSQTKTYFSPEHTVRVLELTPSVLKPNPLGKTSIQQAVERFGNFNDQEKIVITQDLYDNWANYHVDDFDVLTFTPADCNAGTDLLSDAMQSWVRSFKARGKVIIFTHDTALNHTRFDSLLAEFGFTIDSGASASGILNKIKPKTVEDWMKYPYDMSSEMLVTPAHTTWCSGGTSAYVFSDNPDYAWLRYIGNIVYSESGHSLYDCNGTFSQQLSDNEMKIWINLIMKMATWRNAANRVTTTNETRSKIYADVTLKPATTPATPSWSDYRHLARTYLNPSDPLDVYTPDLPEPYVTPITPPVTGSPNDGFAINWRGNIYVPVTGSYQFHATSDDGFRLWIDNQIVIDAWKDQLAVTNTGTITLTGGKWYELSANYYEDKGGAMVKLEWTPPDSQRQVVPAKNFAPFLGYKINGQVREAAPLPWSPMVHNGYFYFQEKEHVLFADKVRLVKTPVAHQILISPRPQQGTAMILRDNEGNILRKVAFFSEIHDSAGRIIDVEQTLENAEEMSGNGFAKYYLAYKDIDPDSLQVKLNGVTISASQYIFDPKKSSIEFMNNLGFDDIMEFRYKLLYSYYVDVNHDVDNDVARIVLHSKYDPPLMKDMEIIYEGAKDTPFYRAEEVSFNPILNHNHRGFLYLTNKVDQDPKVLEISLSPKSLPTSTVSKVLVTGRVLDKYNNPIQNKEVDIYRDGELMMTGKTNRAGEVYLYDQPVVQSDNISRYQIVCADLSNMEQLHFYVPDVANRVYIEMKTSKAILLAGQNDEATITITLRDENWSVLRGQQIKVAYKDTKGITRSFNPTTNDYGQASITVSGLAQVQGVIAITATCTVGAEVSSNFIFLKVIGA